MDFSQIYIICNDSIFTLNPWESRLEADFTYLSLVCFLTLLSLLSLSPTQVKAMIPFTILFVELKGERSVKNVINVNANNLIYKLSLDGITYYLLYVSATVILISFSKTYQMSQRNFLPCKISWQQGFWI